MDAISYCALQKDHERPLSLQIIPCGKSLHHLMIVMVAVSHYPAGASSVAPSPTIAEPRHAPAEALLGPPTEAACHELPSGLNSRHGFWKVGECLVALLSGGRELVAGGAEGDPTITSLFRPHCNCGRNCGRNCGCAFLDQPFIFAAWNDGEAGRLPSNLRPVQTEL